MESQSGPVCLTYLAPCPPGARPALPEQNCQSADEPISATELMGHDGAACPHSWMEQQQHTQSQEQGREGAMVAASSVSRMARRAEEPHFHIQTRFFPPSFHTAHSQFMHFIFF